MLKSHPKGCDFLVSAEFEFNPKYDEVVWSELCFLKEIGCDYYVGGLDLSIVEKNGKYGMIFTEHSFVPNEDSGFPIYNVYGILDCEYDAIYSLHRENKGYFVAFQGGKCGLIQATASGWKEFCDCREIFPCSYDRIELIDTGYCEIIVIQSGENLFYYNVDTGNRSDLYDRIWVEKSFVFCAIDGETEVFYIRNDKFVMKSKNEIDYVGRYKNRYVFIEREGYCGPDENKMPVINGKICFYREGNNTVLKTKRLENITVFKNDDLIGMIISVRSLKDGHKRKYRINLK